jgi:hypothetical protein
MKTYNVSLSRAYVVKVKARDKHKACRYAEYFIGNCHDESNVEERRKYRFSIHEIEMTINDAINAEEIYEVE